MVGTALVGFISLFFLFVGTVKVCGVPKTVFQYQWERFFEKFGLSRTAVRLIGLAEWTGGLAVWAYDHPTYGFVGPGVLLVVTTGAIGFHAAHGRIQDAAPAAVMWAAVAAVEFWL